MRRAMFLTLVLVWLGAACAPPGPSSSESSASDAPAQPARTLVAAISVEPKTLAARNVAQATSQQHLRRIFNADLALLDDQSNPHPYLAEALPQLNSNSWTVFPDGRMETTYRLRPNLVWHDGTPLTADAIVFGYQVYSHPDMGQANSLPFRAITSVEAPDDRTVLIRWKEPYAKAGELQSLGFSAAIGLPPLPRHILGPALEQGALALINHPHWTTEYVGLGPYRLDRWEPGAFIESSAFDRHALGIPKIQRIKLLFLTDANATLASMLTGDVQFTALPVAQAASFMREQSNSGATMVPYFNQWFAAHFQNRPDMVSPAALQDRRVRQALAYAVDRPSLNEALYEGQYPIADSLFAPTSDLGRAANAAVVKYPFDVDRSGQLMAEAGVTKGPDGFYISSGGERFTPDLRGGSGSNDQKITAAMAGTWRQAGFAFTESALSPAQDQDLQARSSYPSLYLSGKAGGEGGLASYGTANVPGPANAWRGSAWEGYSNPEFDRLLAAFGVALDPADRNRIAADIVRLYTTELPAISLFFPVSSNVFSSDVSGHEVRPASSNPSWNIHKWELR